MKLITKTANGKFKVNKAAVIARLKQLRKNRGSNIDISGVLQVSAREIEQEVRDMSRYSADNLRNNSEE